jgi:hypothetical protein
MLPRNTKTLWTKVMGAWLLSLFGTLEFTIEPAKRKCCHKFSASNNALAVRVGFEPFSGSGNV